MTAARSPSATALVEFGAFQFDPGQKRLLRDGSDCQLGGRSMDLLRALVERPGETVTKRDLLERAWPGRFVDEANLRVHMAALRKVLGDGQEGRRFIINVAGRGYCFVAPVAVPTAGPASALDATSDPLTSAVPLSKPVRTRLDGITQATSPCPTHNLPAQLSRVIGRERAINELAAQVREHRFVTVAGPGGMGKTTVATAVAELLLRTGAGEACADGAWFIDLAGASVPRDVPLVTAAALGVSAAADDPVAGLATFLRDKRMLLLLDNCEHVVDDAAALVEAVLRAAPAVQVLATSREALRAAGEWVYRLEPLDTPTGGGCTAAEALETSAVQLFVERAAASCGRFTLTDADAPVVADVCRRLDGLPLAIELAAARIDLFGLRGLAARLDDRVLLASKGRRTAQERQQTLMATLEWSYRLLPPVEQALLRRLSVFRGWFTLEGALDVAGCGLGPEALYSGLATLSAKFMIATDAEDEPVRHRLPHVTRTFAAGLLRDAGEERPVLLSHAGFIQRLLHRAERDWERMDRHDWLALYGSGIDDVRSALDWAFSPTGDASIGLVMTAAALPLGFQLSLVDEFRGRAERALLGAGQADPPQILAEMRLNIAVGALSQNMATPVQGRTAGFYRAVDLAQQLDDPVYQAEPLIGMAGMQLGAGDYPLAVEMAAQASRIAEASGDALAVLGVDRVQAQARHFVGDHAAARHFAQRVLDHPAVRIPLVYNLVPVDRRVSMRIILSRVEWMQGSTEHAAETAEVAIHHAQSDSPFSLCQALALAAIPIALWTGDNPTAATLTQTLKEQAERYTLAHWHSWACGFEALLRFRSGADRALPAPSGTLQADTFATCAPETLTLATAQRAEAGIAGWSAPEVMRVQGEWTLRQAATGAGETAAGLFRKAGQLARHQGALAWELRAATSLARLHVRENRAALARSLLEGMLARFNEGFASVDVVNAKDVLRDAGHGGAG